MPSPPLPPEPTSLVERRIREAIEDGEFDDLPGKGAPIPDIEQPYEATWWVRRFIERERLRGILGEAHSAANSATIDRAPRKHGDLPTPPD